MGRFNLDASAPPGFKLLPDSCSSLDYMNSSFVGWRVWACPPPHLITGYICWAFLAQDKYDQTAMMLVVPV